MIREVNVLRDREELELLNDIRDFTSLSYVILKHESFEWLRSSLMLGLGIAIWSLVLAFRDFAFFKRSF